MIIKEKIIYSNFNLFDVTGDDPDTWNYFAEVDETTIKYLFGMQLNSYTVRKFMTKIHGHGWYFEFSGKRDCSGQIDILAREWCEANPKFRYMYDNS